MITEVSYEEKALIAMLYIVDDINFKNKIKNIPSKYFSSLVQEFFKKYSDILAYEKEKNFYKINIFKPFLHIYKLKELLQKGEIKWKWINNY